MRDFACCLSSKPDAEAARVSFAATRSSEQVTFCKYLNPGSTFTPSGSFSYLVLKVRSGCVNNEKKSHRFQNVRGTETR